MVLGGDVRFLDKDDCVYVPDLMVIEVQYGVCWEDDMVRLTDE